MSLSNLSSPSFSNREGGSSAESPPFPLDNRKTHSGRTLSETTEDPDERLEDSR